MGAVSDQVNKLRIWVRVVAQGRAPLELGVRRQQTGIDDVSVGADTAFSVIDVIGGVLRLVGDAPETPRRVDLCGQLIELPYGILLHSGDLGDCQQGFNKSARRERARRTSALLRISSMVASSKAPA